MDHIHDDLLDEDWDDDDQLDESTAALRGPSWRFTIAISSLSMIFGVIAGVVGDGSVEILNQFYEKSSSTRRSSPHVDNQNASMLAERQAPAQPGWYPENNHVEWSTTLRPNEQPAALDVRNDSRSENRRIMFQVADGRTYRLAATLYVKAGQQAVIRLPIGSYRVDVASSPSSMSWEDAQRIIPIPRYAINLAEPDNEQTPKNRLFIEEDGKIRASLKPTVPAPRSNTNPAREKSSEGDYGSLTKKSLSEDPSADNSESSDEEW